MALKLGCPNLRCQVNKVLDATSVCTSYAETVFTKRKLDLEVAEIGELCGEES